MKPYYDEDGITIYHGDCRDIAPSLECDVVVSDPPYGINYNGEGQAGQTKHQPSNRMQIGTVAHDNDPFDPSPWISGPFILWGSNNFANRLPDLRTWLCWDKVTQNGLKLRIAECEFAATNCVGRSRVFRHLWSGAYRASSEERGTAYHPTQKPVALMAWCMSLPGVPAGVVLDPYMGSGTTLVAAKAEGRRAIGIELEERYCETAANRLSQGVLFGAET
jgi:site-specific DNA-methyltransferase (adenine-specific)